MNTTYANVVDLAAGAVLLSAVLVVWRRELRALVRLLAWQGAALAVIPFVQGLQREDGVLVAVGVFVFGLRAIVLPALLARLLDTRAGGDQAQAVDGRDSTPVLNTAASLLVAAALTVVAFAVSQPLVDLQTDGRSRAVPAGLAVVLIAVFVMTSRRRALSQAVGFLMLDNGIASIAFLISAGVPLIVELGASLDVLFAVIVISMLTGRLSQAFGTTDLDQLRELRDR